MGPLQKCSNTAKFCANHKKRGKAVQVVRTEWSGQVTPSSGNGFDRQETQIIVWGHLEVKHTNIFCPQSYEPTRLSLRYLSLLCDRAAYFSLRLIASSVSLWVVPWNRSNRFVKLSICYCRFGSHAVTGIFFIKEKAELDVIHKQRWIMSALNWSAVCGLKRKVKQDWPQPCAFYVPRITFSLLFPLGLDF